MDALLILPESVKTFPQKYHKVVAQNHLVYVRYSTSTAFILRRIIAYADCLII